MRSTAQNRPKQSIDHMPVSAVFDTNVYISIFAFPGKPLAALWDLVVTGEIELFVSPPIIDEFQKIIQSKFHFSPEETQLFTDRILNSATLLEPSQKLTVVRDHEEDNRILECAVEAKATHLISGDKKHLIPLKKYRGIKILSAAEFLRLL